MSREENPYKEYALRRLARISDHSVTLARALKLKGANERQIRAIIEECERLGYLDDADWVALFIRSQKKKGYGDRLIRQKLMVKGIPQQEIEQALMDSEEESPENAIQKLLSTRLKSKEKEKQIASLLRRGFTYDDISSVLHFQ